MLFLTLAARNLEVLTVRLLLGMQCWRFAPIPKPFQMRTYWVYPSVYWGLRTNAFGGRSFAMLFHFISYNHNILL